MKILQLLLLPLFLVTLSSPASAAADQYSYEGRSSHFYCLNTLVPYLRVKYGIRFEQISTDHLLLWKSGDVVGEAIYRRDTNHCSIVLK